MSVIIKGYLFKEPYKCEHCPFEFYERDKHKCKLIYHGMTEEIRQFGRLNDCPILSTNELIAEIDGMKADCFAEDGWNSYPAVRKDNVLATIRKVMDGGEA